jgi:signal recognition particle receptor subunit beta
VQTSYLKDASGIFIVVDGTRRQTLDTGLALRARAEEAVGIIPSVMVFNKWDLKDQWKIDDRVIEKLTDQGMAVASTSAKTGRGVEDAFLTLTRSMLKE